MLHWMTARLYRKMILSHIGMLVFFLVVTFAVGRWAFQSTIQTWVHQQFSAQTKVFVKHLREDFRRIRRKRWRRAIRRYRKNPSGGAGSTLLPWRWVKRAFRQHLQRKHLQGPTHRWQGEYREFLPTLRRSVRESSLLLGAYVRIQTKDGRCLMEARPSRIWFRGPCHDKQGKPVECRLLHRSWGRHRRHRSRRRGEHERAHHEPQGAAGAFSRIEHKEGVVFHEDRRGFCRLAPRWLRGHHRVERRWRARARAFRTKWRKYWRKKARQWGLPLRSKESHQQHDHDRMLRFSLLQGSLHVSYARVFPFPVRLGGLFFLVYGILILVGIAVTAVPISRGITKPLRKLQRGVKHIQQGNLDEEIQIRGHDEVSQLACSIEEMRRTLKDLSQERQDLLSDISHEIRTPLARIRTVAESVADGLMREPERLTQAMEGQCRQVDEVDQLLGDLLDIARFDLPDQNRLERSEIYLPDLMREIVRTLEATAQAQDMTLLLEPYGLLPTVSADSRRLRQVLNNLIQNAIRYSPAGGDIRLSVSIHEARLFLPEKERETSGDNEEIERNPLLGQTHFLIQVRDQGPGIPVHERTKIFERFYRLDPSRSRQTGGQGLGLAIVKKIVLAHNGSITVEDAPGGGACFCIRLPLIAE